MRKGYGVGLVVLAFLVVSCSGLAGNKGDLGKYPVPEKEAQWIRDGEPLTFEGERWVPQDGIEILLDDEVYVVAEYHGVTVFVEAADVRPYNRLYTKVGKNKFRVFSKSLSHD